jgi:hypothetical protein
MLDSGRQPDSSHPQTPEINLGRVLTPTSSRTSGPTACRRIAAELVRHREHTLGRSASRSTAPTEPRSPASPALTHRDKPALLGADRQPPRRVGEVAALGKQPELRQLLGRRPARAPRSSAGTASTASASSTAAPAPASWSRLLPPSASCPSCWATSPASTERRAPSRAGTASAAAAICPRPSP